MLKNFHKLKLRDKFMIYNVCCVIFSNDQATRPNNQAG